MTLTPHQRQRCAQTERGNSSLGLSAHTCVAGNDPQHDRSGNRAGFNGSSYAQTGGAMSRAFHCRSAAGISPHSRRPVLDTLSGIGLNSPAERIRAARGAFNSVHGFGANRPHAQSLAHQQTVNVSADVPHIQPRLSSSAVSVGIDPNERQLTCRTSLLCSRSKNL